MFDPEHLEIVPKALTSMTSMTSLMTQLPAYPPDPMIGTLAGPYRVGERLGAGGMGVVYRGDDTRLGRSVALKFLPPELGHRGDARHRFVQEAKSASALDHPNICTIYQIGETAVGRPYIAMACYEGESLEDRLSRGPLPVAEALDVARQVAAGLSESHRRDIIHRDIKPANIWLTPTGLVKILDFGLAKVLGEVGITRTGSSMGTPAYMSPEQTRGEPIDARSDLWALGVLLFEALTGRLPFAGKNVASILYAIHGGERPDLRSLCPGLDASVATVVDRLLARDLTKRYADAYSLCRDLAALTPTHLSGSGHPTPPSGQPVLRLLDTPPPERTPYEGKSPSQGTPRPTPLERPPSGAGCHGSSADPYAELMTRGIEAALARDYPTATDCFEEALRLRPDDSRARFNLERIRRQTGSRVGAQPRR